jgi:hypothetical protein
MIPTKNTVTSDSVLATIDLTQAQSDAYYDTIESEQREQRLEDEFNASSSDDSSDDY